MKFCADSKEPPLASLIIIKLLNAQQKIIVQLSPDAHLMLDDIIFDSDISACRHLAALFPNYKLYGSSAIQNIEIDHWLTFGIGPFQNTREFHKNVVYLNKELSTVTYLVGEELTIADVVIWTLLFKNQQWRKFDDQQFLNISRWYSFIAFHNCVQQCLESLSKEIKIDINPFNQQLNKNSNENKNMSTEKKEDGKFIELPDAEMGKVVVRFPPEASGYLHIGHAKAALLNQYYKDKFNGKLIMRFDDTNPAKEKIDFEKVILEDLEMLQIKPDIFTHTSDYFELMLKYCEKLIQDGKAYVDDTDPEIMKQERDKRVESKRRNNSVCDNMKMWEKMKLGTDCVQCCVRAKIDMNSDNGCLRDPTIYRCKPENHPKTGNTYKVYPTYDFACPIVDSIEGVTHCLRTTEYHDRDDQFYWFIDALNLRKPYIWEYSRLNMTNTVLSKRKLTWFVEEGYVDGWDDPRFPTVRGILRRGMTVAGLKQFIIAQGSSRSVVSMEWDKIWAFNKKVIDPAAPRYNALESTGTVPVIVENIKTEKLSVAKHPKNEDVGKKYIWKSGRILIDYIDAIELKENENATFINWGNLLITKIIREGSKIICIEAKENLSNTDYKKTLKLTWLSDIKEAPFVPCICVYFDHIITKPVLNKDEDFKNFINPCTKTERKMLGDPELVNVKKGDIIQLQRRGFYICEKEYEAPSIFTGNGSPIILFFIPDGHSKETPITAQSKKDISKDTVVKVDEKIKNNQVSEKKKHQKIKQKTVCENVSETNFVCITDPNILEEVNQLVQSIKIQGDLIRRLKVEKCEKNAVDNEVHKLLSLKKSFKSLTNVEWKPDVIVSKLSSVGSNYLNENQNSEQDLYISVCLQTSKIRYMQMNKVDKNLINTEVTFLADLKEKYKIVSGKEWAIKEGVRVNDYYDKYIDELFAKVTAQGNKVRQLKTEKVNKNIIDSEVKKLLILKGEYKEATGTDYKPPEKNPDETKVTESKKPNTMTEQNLEIHNKIVEQGNKVRKLKSDKTNSKELIDNEIKILLELKNTFKEATGVSWTPSFNPQNESSISIQKPTSTSNEKVAISKSKQVIQKTAAEPSTSNTKKQTRLGLEARKDENLSDWYTQVITKSELIEYYDVSGCYTLRPWAFAIWKTIRTWFENAITDLGVDECYFPIFVSKSALEKEKAHIADFAPEVAWVTKSGDSELEEPVAIRPTSETVMYPAYAKWIRSYRDLPLKLNQWNNVVRWEFKHPQPFLRTREFLWQEGHTAYASQKEAEEEVYTILDLYAKIYTDLLAIPVIKGRKTEKEKFAGGDFTTTVEAFISTSGRAIQGATSHYLGQNFSKMFEIVFEDPETQEKKFVYQNSWGITTRTIGVMIMVHADDQGLVLPPRVAKIQVVIVPCGISVNMKSEERESLNQSCKNLEDTLRVAGIKTHYDSRDNYSSGWKFNHWELKGVPVRIELGPKDLKQNQVVAVRRDEGAKLNFKRDSIVSDVKQLLDEIHQSMYKRSEEEMKNHTVICEDWSLFNKILNEKNMLLSPFCGEILCEDKIKQDSARNEELDPGAPSMGAKSLCIPFDQPKKMSASQKCIHPECNNLATFYTLFGRSY